MVVTIRMMVVMRRRINIRMKMLKIKMIAMI